MNEIFSGLSIELLFFVSTTVATAFGSIAMWVVNKWSEERTYRALERGIEDLGLLDNEDLLEQLRPLYKLIERNNKLAVANSRMNESLKAEMKLHSMKLAVLEKEITLLSENMLKSLNNIKVNRGVNNE